MQVLVTVKGDDQVNRMFNGFINRVGKPQRAFAEIAEVIAKDNAAKYGKGTPALAPTTVTTKQGKGLNPGKLDATGAMKEQITSAEEGTRLITGTELAFGTTKFYARFAQYGTKSTPTHTGEVKRRVLRFTKTAQLASIEIIRAHIMRERA